MLKRLRHCAHCGAEMQILRNTKTYCSGSCRKQAARGTTDFQQSRWIVECLRGFGFLGQIWPVYAWDDSPPVFALMVTSQSALEELNLHGDAFTEGELERALRDCGVETTSAGERLKAEIRAFYQARKDRRFRQGYTPADNDGGGH